MSDHAVASIDRIVDGVAVLLVEPDETEQHLPAEELPDDAQEGSIVRVQLSPLRVVRVDHEETARRRSDAEARLERIRREKGGKRFGR